MRSDLAQAAVRDLELRAAANRHRLMLLALATVAIALVVDVVHIDWRAGVDFHTYFAAAEVGLNHGWSHIYDQEVVGLEQKELVPTQWAQPFLSPPPVAWLTAPFLPLPYKVALAVWAFILFSALALAFAWAGVGRGLGRWIAVFGALSTWLPPARWWAGVCCATNATSRPDWCSRPFCSSPTRRFWCLWRCCSPGGAEQLRPGSARQPSS